MFDSSLADNLIKPKKKKKVISRKQQRKMHREEKKAKKKNFYKKNVKPASTMKQKPQVTQGARYCTSLHALSHPYYTC